MIEQFYDNFLASEQVKDKETREEKISMSSLGGCIRKLLMMGKPEYPSEPVDKYTLRTFRHGKILENDIRLALIDQKVLIAEQLELEYRGISGHLDFIVKNEKMGQNYLFDIKTAKESSFQYLDKKNNEMSEDYKYQLTSYYYSKGTDGQLIKDKYKLPPMAMISYVSKDNSLFYEPVLNVEEFKPKLDAKIDEIEAWQKEGALPPEMTEWEGRKVKGVRSKTDVVGYPCFSIQKEQYTRKEVGVKAWCPKIAGCEKIYAKYLAEKSRIEGGK